MNPKVSIIVPVYKVERYLDKCVQSLLGQTLTDIEIILVDDHSPDTCPTLCDQYAVQDERVKVVHKPFNEGLGFARNTGLEVSTGEYVAFTDSDDYECIETYETLYHIAKGNDCDVVYYRFIENDNPSINPKISYLSQVGDIKKLMLNMVGNAPSSSYERDIQVSSCLGMYRRDIIMNNKCRFHSERELISEDLVFNLDVLFHSCRVAVTGFQFYFYRVNANSLTHAVRRDRHEMNKKYYLFLVKKMGELGLGDDGIQRSTRLFIGYSRGTILMICQSTLSFREKRKWSMDICKDSIWDAIHNEYPYKQLPLKYRLFFSFMYKGWFMPLYCMSLIKWYSKMNCNFLYWRGG